MKTWIANAEVFCLFDLILNVPANNFSVMSGQVFLGWTSTKKDKCVLLKDTTQWRWWHSEPRPLGLESSTLTLSHCAPSNAEVML